jgi:hypothetical protein
MTQNNPLWRRSAAALLLAGLLSTAHAGNRDADIDQYLNVFANASPVEQKNACESLSWEGISDPRLFDEIEKKLLAVYISVGEHRESDSAAWLVKALAYSGQAKYQATLAKVAQHGGTLSLRNYAKNAQVELTHYAQWNPIIADDSQQQTSKSPQVNRFANMLRSGDKNLQEVAARRIIEQPLRDELLYDLLQQQASGYIHANLSEGEEKPVAFMLKALAASGQEKYLATVREASESATSSTVRKYAKSYVKKAG